MELNKKEKEIILKSLIEYEERMYMSESKIWQKNINELIDKFKEVD